MEKICYINQPSGLGDILMCEPIARHYYNLGYKIIYWVREDYLWIRDYIKYINFISINDNYTTSDEAIFSDEMIYLPVMHKRLSNDADWVNGGWLYDKYRVAKLDYNLWKTFDYTRNEEKENELFQKLGLENKDYILVNEYSSVGRRKLNIDSEYDIVYMSNIPEFTMLDWGKIIENAKEVHTVSTSIVFPAFKMNHPNLTIYSRHHKNDSTISTIIDVFKSYKPNYE
jgi:hypothetical protein